MALLGNPQDVLTTPYGYSGQMAPETAIAEQALNRRRLLANMLTQQGLQPAQGRMAGRFYVAPSPLQGGAGLAQVLAGTLGNRMIDNQQGDLIKKDQKDKDDFIADWHAKQKLLNAMSQAPVGAAPSQAPPVAPESAPPAPPTLPAGAGPETMQNIGPRPQSYNGEVGAFPSPETQVQSQNEPIPAPPVQHSGKYGLEQRGLSQDVTPGDMSTMVNSADPAKAQAQLGEQPPMPPPAQVAPPAPPQAPAPMQPGPPRKTTMEDLAQLMTHQHPQVRAYGQFLAQQMQKEQEREIAERHRQEDMGLKMLEHNTPSGSAKMMSEAQQATAKEANAARVQEMTLRHNDEQKKLEELARHHGSVEKYNADKQALDAQQARERNAIDLKIAGMKAQQKGELPAKAVEMELEELDAIGRAAGIQSDLSAIRGLIQSKDLNLGPGQNLMSEGKNYLGLSDQNSRNYASLKTAVENMRNETLILQKGVQTEGDAKRALNALISNLNDPKNVEQQLKIIEEKNARAIELRKNKISALRKNFGAGPIDTKQFEQVQPVSPKRETSPSAAPSMKNAQGWVLHTDANGNKAYVSPDGKQFEEVR